MNTEKCVIFDVGRVLIEWDVFHLYRTLLPSDEAIREFLAETDMLAYNVAFDRGLPYASGIAELCAKFPHRAELIRALDDRWMECVPGAIDASVDVLWRLKDAGVPRYAITNFSTEKWALSQQRFDFLREGFIDVVVSAEEKIIKPDPAIFEICLTRNKLNAADCVFIDDSAKNIAAAEALGMDGVLFTEETDIASELKIRGIAL